MRNETVPFHRFLERACLRAVTKKTLMPPSLVAEQSDSPNPHNHRHIVFLKVWLHRSCHAATLPYLIEKFATV